MKDCLFCDFVAGRAHCFSIWQDEDHMAFLTPFPNTEGVTVVIPKMHQDSYLFNVDEDVMLGLVKAAKTVGLNLDSKFDDVGRTAMVFEGFGINHLHAKLFPMHGTGDMSEWKAINSDIDTYFENYRGYISSHDSKRVDDDELQRLAEKLKF